MPDSDTTPDIPPQRLCGEIQLFDLCELDSCRYKTGRFCSDPVLLSRFEKIADAELRSSERYVFEEPDDPEADEDDYDEDGHDDADDRFEREHSDGDDAGWQDEE
ncbi:MAG: hypothetical protein ACOYL3_24945 [Desulfuromonadaceae bacterium]